MIILTRLEWNMPPGKGDEHATVLFPPAMESTSRLVEFKKRFDDLEKRGEDPELARQALDC